MNDEKALDDLLNASANPSADAALRDTMLAGTIKILHRRRRVRRAAMALALAGCYLAGAATVTLVRPSAAEGELAHRASKSEPAHFQQEPYAEPSIANDRSQTAATFTALRKPRTQFESLRDLGDKNLFDRRDPEAATRCYCMALRYATHDERTWAATEGTWLLRAVNQTFRLESIYDPAQSKVDSRS